jgi:hypothetical protein
MHVYGWQHTLCFQDILIRFTNYTKWRKSQLKISPKRSRFFTTCFGKMILLNFPNWTEFYIYREK